MYEQTIDKINKLEKEYVEAVKQVEVEIDKIGNDDIKLMLKYSYLEFMSIPEIASKLYVSVRTVQRWHKSIVEK